MRFHFFTLNLNNNSPPPPTQCCLGLFSARNKHHTISFVNDSINIEKGARGSSFFCEICENITTHGPLRTNQLAFHKLLAMIDLDQFTIHIKIELFPEIIKTMIIFDRRHTFPLIIINFISRE